MKKYSILLGATFCLFALASCQKEKEVEINTPDDNVSKHVPFALKAQVPETRTTIDAETWEMAWEDGDILYAVTTDEEWGAAWVSDEETNLETIAEFTYSNSDFSTEQIITDGEHTFHFLYTANTKQKTWHRGAGSSITLQGTQNEDALDPTSALKINDALAGRVTATTPTTFVNVPMNHLFTLMKVTLKNKTGASITVNSFEISATNADLAGNFAITFGDTPSVAIKSGQTGINKIVVNITNGTIANNGDLPVYFVMAPLSSYSGEIKFKVTDSDGKTYTKTNSVSNVTFTAGQYNTANYTLKAADAPEQAVYKRITAMADLTTDDYVIVGEKTATSWGSFAYGTLNSGRVAYVEEYTSASNLPEQIENPAGEKVWHITRDGSTITLLNAVESKYLSIGNDGKFSWNSNTGTAITPSVSNNYFSFNYNGSSTFYLGVNKDANVNWWRMYASSTLTATNGLALYKKDDPNAVILSFDKTSESFLATDDNTVSKTFTATLKNVSTWTVTNSNPTDFTVTENVSEKTIVVKPVAVNTTFTEKTATITVEAAGAETQTLIVSQAAKVPVFLVSASATSIPANDATAIITVSSNISWQVSYDANLATATVPDPAIGFDATDQSFVVNFTNNSTNDSRDIVVTVTPDNASGLEAQSITFVQVSLAAPAILDVVYNYETIHSLDFDKDGETKYGLYIQTNEHAGSAPQITITGADASSFSYSFSYYENTEQYTFFDITAVKNNTNKEKTATLTINYGDAIPWVVSLTQDAGDTSISKVDFESELSTYSDWTFTNLDTENTAISAKEGSKYANNGTKTTASARTKDIIESPKSLTCYYSKCSTNTNNSSKFTIDVSSDGTTWTTVATGKTMDKVTKGTWEELTADLSSYSNVYVRVYYNGTNATRALDEITLVY
ncbi:MAG: hypothetical protein IKX20_11490 [Paludibacteraceae bacterium]|nr:hypothetical protein [Paludibacteraceae bacterium]